jgi:hypothetical protein
VSKLIAHPVSYPQFGHSPLISSALVAKCGSVALMWMANCSLATLDGGFGVTGLGSTSPNNVAPTALVGHVEYAGASNFAVTETVSRNG